jgi:hypothetical protein
MVRVYGFEADSPSDLGDDINVEARRWDKVLDVQYAIYRHPSEGQKFTALVTFMDEERD